MLNSALTVLFFHLFFVHLFRLAHMTGYLFLFLITVLLRFLDRCSLISLLMLWFCCSAEFDDVCGVLFRLKCGVNSGI
jgi:hypothetical protein